MLQHGDHLLPAVGLDRDLTIIFASRPHRRGGEDILHKSESGIPLLAAPVSAPPVRNHKAGARLPESSRRELSAATDCWSVFAW